MLTVKQLNDGLKRAASLWSNRDTLAMDVRIAERDGDLEAVKIAKAIHDQNQREWYNQRMANKSDIREWLLAAGFEDPTAVGNALRD